MRRILVGSMTNTLFTGRRPVQTMNNRVRQSAVVKAGLGDLQVHNLRHTVVLRLRECGVPESTISAILWHSNKSMTVHYSMAQSSKFSRLWRKSDP
jgi:integrase